MRLALRRVISLRGPGRQRGPPSQQVHAVPAINNQSCSAICATSTAPLPELTLTGRPLKNKQTERQARVGQSIDCYWSVC
jgi:hypothetical protein